MSTHDPGECCTAPVPLSIRNAFYKRRSGAVGTACWHAQRGQSRPTASLRAAPALTGGPEQMCQLAAGVPSGVESRETGKQGRRSRGEECSNRKPKEHQTKGCTSICLWCREASAVRPGKTCRGLRGGGQTKGRAQPCALCRRGGAPAIRAAAARPAHSSLGPPPLRRRRAPLGFACQHPGVSGHSESVHRFAARAGLPQPRRRHPWGGATTPWPSGPRGLEAKVLVVNGSELQHRMEEDRGRGGAAA